MNFSDAKKLYDDGKYDQALEAYRKIGTILGDKVVEFNINKCLDKIHEDEKNINVNTISANTISAEYEKKIRCLILYSKLMIIINRCQNSKVIHLFLLS